jgi:hypothetical protein
MSGEHSRAVQTYECADDAEVILKAWTLVESHPEHQNVEIWEGKRLVASFSHVPKLHRLRAPSELAYQAGLEYGRRARC